MPVQRVPRAPSLSLSVSSLGFWVLGLELRTNTRALQ